MSSTAIRVFRVLSVLYALLVIAVSSLSGIRIPDLGVEWSDKIAHFAQYAVLAFLVAGGWGRIGRPTIWSQQWRPLVFMIVFAAADEFHQLWVPRREASLVDWTADSLGILVGFFVGLIILRRWSEIGS